MLGGGLMNPLIKNWEASSQANRRRDFDELNPLRVGQVSLNPAEVTNVPTTLEFAEKTIGAELASAERVEKVIARNKDNITLVRKGDEIIGVIALLMLRARGLEALLLGEIDLRDPDEDHLTIEEEIPAAIYVWGIVLPGTASEALRIMSMRLRSEKFFRANLFSRPVTPGGARMMASLGFEPIPQSPIGLFRYLRKANRQHHFGEAA